MRPPIAPAGELPADRLTHAQAAAILGVHRITVSTWVITGALPSLGRYAKANLRRSDVETLAAARWRPGDPSWLTTDQAAAMLGVSRVRVTQLIAAGRLPAERHPSGRWLFRPGQIAVIAQARRDRFHPSHTDDQARTAGS